MYTHKLCRTAKQVLYVQTQTTAVEYSTAERELPAVTAWSVWPVTLHAGMLCGTWNSQVWSDSVS